jgi:hypothetical protein
VQSNPRHGARFPEGADVGVSLPDVDVHILKNA